jgi:glycosyltransferase involved in cell wall biosynthesis
VAVIPNPVVLPISGSGPDLDPARIVRNRRFALAVGRLVEQKGFRRLIGAFAKVAAAAPDWDLVILGGGPERAALEAHLLQLGLLERVHLPGRVGNVGRWYASAGMYVLSSYYEGFPNALLEAMAYGVPSISIDCPTGPADIIRHGVDGLLVNDMDGLADGMGRLMRDERERAEMSSRAREVADRFSLDRVGALWARMLDDPRHAGAAPQEAP